MTSTRWRPRKEAERAAKEVDQAMAQPGSTRNGDGALAAVFDEAENDLNDSLRNLHQVAESTAAALVALSCGTGDRMDNVRTSLG